MPSDEDSPTPTKIANWLRGDGTDLYPVPTAATITGLPNYGFLLVIIPAHNEGQRIAHTLNSLRQQTRQADAVIVAADNCTDDTVSIALAGGVTVIETTNNSLRKAGALNQTLNAVLPKLDGDDVILLMDADTRLNDNFIASVTSTLWSDTGRTLLGGVGGVFMGDMQEWSLIQQFQQNEYVRYARKLGRRHGRALVLTGTGSIFRVRVLREIIDGRRNGTIPDVGVSQSVYDTDSLTEDNELTLAVKSLGMRTVSPKDCQVYTALMPTLRNLYTQRRRWQRGALENLMTHGLHSYTAPYIAKQVAAYVAIMFLPLYVSTLTTQLVRGGDHGLFPPFWVGVAILYVVEQTWSVRRGGWRGVVLSAFVVPEIIYSMFLDVVFLVSIAGLVTARQESWGRGIDTESDDSVRAQGVGAIAKAPRLHHYLVRGAALLAIFCTLSIALIPVANLRLAWTMVAIFVITGSVNTVIRLVPLRER